MALGSTTTTAAICLAWILPFIPFFFLPPFFTLDAFFVASSFLLLVEPLLPCPLPLAALAIGALIDPLPLLFLIF